jgi:hypothetical protein
VSPECKRESVGTGAFARPASEASVILITRLRPALKPARLLVFQSPRNPTERDREILTLLAKATRKSKPMDTVRKITDNATSVV